MSTSREQLLQWLAEPEGARLEFKEAKSNFHFDKLVEYCVALANEGGGKMIFGASDRRPRAIVGSLAFAEPGRTEAGLYQQLSQRIPVEELQFQDDFFRIDIPTFDEVPVREAVLSALAHRDYRLNGSVFVRQYAKRLEIVSPGGLPPGITPENIVDQQNPRNRRLAEALAKCGLIERSGQGLNLMVETAIRQGKPLPNFAGTASHEVRLTLEGGVRNPGFVRFIERLGKGTLRSFTTRDYLALECLQHERDLPAPLKERLPGLVAAGAVETVGRGKGTHYILSEALYAVLGAKGTHTRKKGLDHETNKALLLKHLGRQGSEGAPLAELRQVLPALPASAVQGLLAELRTEGRVALEGLRRWARWRVVSGELPKKPSA